MQVHCLMKVSGRIVVADLVWISSVAVLHHLEVVVVELAVVVDVVDNVEEVLVDTLAFAVAGQGMMVVEVVGLVV